ncbi:MAK10-like protein [Tanacetum coccineum]
MWCLCDPTPLIASNWLECLPAGSISIWEDLTTHFLAQFFPPGRTTKLRNDILMFEQHHGESLFEAWTHFKDLLQKVPHHGIDLWLQIQIFYDHVSFPLKREIDHAVGGKLRDKSTKESWGIIEDIALYGNESWNNPRDFAKPVKAISLPQDVPSTPDCRLIELENQVQRLMEAHLAPKPFIQVNKIASSCEIYGGPHDTQYSMENSEKEDEPKETKISESSTTNGGDQNLVVEVEKAVEKEPKASKTIQRKFITNAYIDLDLPMNVKSLAYYNTIRNQGYEHKGLNFVGNRTDMHVFVGNMRIILSDDDVRRGCESPLDLENGFYKDIDKLSLSYS